MESTDTFMGYIGSVSTSASRRGRFLGHAVMVAKYKRGHDVVLQLDNAAIRVRGIDEVVMTQDAFDKWVSDRPEGLHISIYALRLFDCVTPFCGEGGES